MAINAGLGVQIPSVASSSNNGLANNLNYHDNDDEDGHYDTGYANGHDQGQVATAGSLDFARRLLHSPPTSPPPRRVPLEHRSRSDSARSELSFEDGYLDHGGPVASTSSPNGNTSSARRKAVRTKSGNIPSKSSEERRALRRLVAMYEQLSSQLDATLERETDLETNLKIARSNLALAENHAEQLEDTIKRNSVALARLSSSSTAGGTSPNPGNIGSSLPRTARGSPNLPSLATVPQNQQLHTGESDAEQAPSPRLGSFWRRRPTVGAASNPNLAQLATGGLENGRTNSRTSRNRKRVSYEDGSESEDPQSAVSVLRKPSFGMLRSSSANTAPAPLTEREKVQATQIASLQSSLQALQESYNSLDSEHSSLKSSYEVIANKYSSLQEEIENLSVSLFEEANTMVAEERKVNTFLNEQLDKAKEEVEGLQKELEELRAFKVSQEQNTQQRRMSPEQALLNNYRMQRKGSVASSIDSSVHKRSRRRSSVAAIDLLESVVAAHSPTTRRASRDMAAAAAAVRALTQKDEEDNMPPLGNNTPRRTSYQMHLQQQRGETSVEGSIAFPRSASPLSRSTSLATSQTRERQTSLSKSQLPSSTTLNEPEESSSAVEGEEDADSASQPIPARQRWFSFGSRKRPKAESLQPNVPPSTSHGLNGETSPLSPIPSSPAASSAATMSPALPPRPPSTSNSTIQQQQHGHKKSLSVASALDAIRPSTSNSSLATLAGNRPVNKANLEVAHSAPMQTSISDPSASSSAPLEVPPSNSRSASSLSQRERFFSQASPSAANPDVEPTLPVSVSTKSLSASADASMVLSPASRELDDLLQDMEQDSIGSRYFGLADSVNTVRQAHDPDAQDPQDPHEEEGPIQSSLTFDGAGDPPLPSTQLSGVRRKNVPTRIDTSLSALRTSGLRPPTPNSGGTSPFPMPTPPPFKRFPSSNSFRSPLPSPSSGETTALPFSDSSNKRSATPTGLKSTSLSKSSLPKLSTSGLPSGSSLNRSDTLGSATSFKSLNAYMDSSSLRSGLERQNSGLSGSGSLVEDLDSLLKSIDAIHESLGLEEE